MRTLQLRALGRFTTWYLLAQDMPQWPSVFVFVFFFFFQENNKICLTATGGAFYFCFFFFKKITRYASLPLVGPFFLFFFKKI